MKNVFGKELDRSEKLSSSVLEGIRLKILYCKVTNNLEEITKTLAVLSKEEAREVCI